MRKKLLKQQFLLVLLTMLIAIPQGVWAEEYDLWIGDVQVTDDNSLNIQGVNIKVGFARFIRGNDGSNTLQLHNIQTKDCIKSGLGDLTIELYGHNRIGYIANQEDNPAIYSTNGGTLTLTKGTTHASLYVETMNVTSVIYGFQDFNYSTVFSVEASGGLYSQELGLNDGNYGVQAATFYTGDLYPLWVGGTQVSSANLDDIKDDNITAGTMSYNPDTKTLTMTNVTADMASDDNCFIESTIDDLKVNLLGTNEVTLNYSMYENDNCFARLKTGTGSLTFDTQRAQDTEENYVFGSLTVNLSSGPSTVIDGSTDKSLVAQGYTISNTFGDETPCWRISDDLTDQVKVWYDGETYGLTIAKISVTSANASNVLGDAITGTVSYDAATNTLTLDNVDLSQYGSNEYSRMIRYSGTDDLTIALKGDNNLSKIEYSSAGSGTPTLSFVKADDADNCTLELNYSSSTSSESVIFLFKDVDFGNLFTITDGPIAMEQFSDDPNQKNLKYSLREYSTSVEHLVITSATTYPLWVINKQVTEENKDKLTSVENSTITFSYNADTDKNTLTFNETSMTNRNIISGLPNLTIHLKGMNEISGGGYNNPLKNGILSVDPSAVLTFTSDVENSSPTGSLYFRNYVTTPFSGFASYTYDNGLAYARSDEVQCVGLINYFSIGEDDDAITSASLSIGESVSFNNETNTLSLNGVGDAGVIRYYQNEDITIEFDGANSTGYIAGTGNGNLYVKKAANAETPSLNITGNNDGQGAISGFRNCTWEEGLYMNPYTYKEIGGYTVLSGVYFDTETGHFTHPSSSIDRITFSTEQAAATPSIWIGDAEVNGQGVFVNAEEQTIEGASFAVVEGVNVLTLSGTEQEASIVSSLPNLTIKLSGVNDMSQIVSSNPSAVLTIVKDSEAESGSLALATELASVISGFADVELSGMYYVCPEMYEYNTTSKKFVDPTNNNDITSLTITSTEAYPLWVGGTQVTAGNASNVLGDDYSSVSYSDGTLTLKGAQIIPSSEDVIIIGEEVEALTVHLVGYNQIASADHYAFSLSGNTALTFTTSEKMPGSLVSSGNVFNEEQQPSVTYQNGLTLNAINTEIKAETVAMTVTALTGSVAYVSDGYIYSSPFPFEATKAELGDDYAVVISTPENATTTELWTTYINNPANVLKFTVQFDWGTCTNKNVTVQVVGYNQNEQTYEYEADGKTYSSVVALSSADADGIVEIPLTSDVTSEQLRLRFSSDAVFSFVPLNIGVKIKPDAPNFCTYETPATIGFEDFSGDEIRYTIDYASDDLEDVEETSWTNTDGAIIIAGPCTVTAWVVKDGVSSDVVKGKYFGPASTKQTIVLGDDPVALAIAPAIEEGDGIMIYGIESSYVSFDETTQKATATTMGSGSFPVPLKNTGDENEEGNTFILNYSNFAMQVEVVTPLDVAFVDDNLWASYYSTEEEGLAVPEGLTAYVVSAVNEKTGAVTVASVGYIPKNNAVLLKREQNGAASGYTAAEYTGNTTTVNNLLSGSPNTTDISSLGSGPVYVLFNDKFKRATSGTIPARRAYLALGAAVAPSGAPRFMNISIGDGSVTAIKTVAVDDNSNDSWYTIDGLKLNGKPQRKGLYINKGKKMYINNNK